MPISHDVDEGRRRLTLTFSGAVSSRAFSDYVVELYKARPELFTYDCVTDLRSYEGDLSNADLKPLVELYAKHAPPGARARSYFVTSDKGFVWWAAAINDLFPGRVHNVVTDISEAHARLDRGE